MIVDWSYNYHANDMSQQVTPIESRVKNKTKLNNLQTLFAVNFQLIMMNTFNWLGT